MLMLVHVRLLDAILGPDSCIVELILSQQHRVPFEPLPGPKGTRRFWICWIGDVGSNKIKQV